MKKFKHKKSGDVITLEGDKYIHEKMKVEIPSFLIVEEDLEELIYDHHEKGVVKLLKEKVKSKI